MAANLTVGQAATLACLLEVSVPKPGNVHRSADFHNMSFHDFVISAVAIGPAMQRAKNCRLGQTVLDSIQATRQWVNVNTNLGLVLLLAPLASVDSFDSHTLSQFFSDCDETDSQQVYQAIRLAGAGGLGSPESDDVAGPPPKDLLQAMRAAADRDLIARQYASGFADLFEVVVPMLETRLQQGHSLTDAVIWTHVNLMVQFPDSLIARKNGAVVASQSAMLAEQVLQAEQSSKQEYLQALSDLDFWLRSDGNRRNPGTTADMIGAALFVGLQKGTIRPNEHSLTQLGLDDA